MSSAKISVTGVCLSNGGITGQRCVLTINGKSSQLAELSYECDGPSKPKIMVDNEDEYEDNVDIFFVPLVAGDYKVSIKHKDKPIEGSPYTVKVTGDNVEAASLISEVKIIGKANELAKAFVTNDFVIDCRDLHPIIGDLTVHTKGPPHSAAHIEIKDNHNGLYNVFFKPTMPGTYDMDIRIADVHIPGSPFKVRVTEYARRGSALNVDY